MITLTEDAVRGLMIAAQGLDDTPRQPATKADVLTVIRRMGQLQIDSINAVARAPYFVLWSRLGDYEPDWLDELFEEGALFEYWAHANCFLPIEDYPLHLAGNWMTDWRQPHQWLDEHVEIAEYVMNRVRDEGGARASDFKRADGIKYTWDNPKEEQVALEYFVYVGEMMVRKREKFQRVYDLRERVYPGADKLPKVSRDVAEQELMLYGLKALGVAKADWIGAYFRVKPANAKIALDQLEKDGRVLTVEVEEWDEPGYIHPDNLPQVQAAAEGHIPQSRTNLLSPFDPLVRERGQTLDLFKFDFPVEFYFPAAKRKYGYFSTPILYKNQLVGRIDPKAHRKEGIFEIKTMHLEPGVEINDELVEAVQGVVQACADWHKTPRVVFQDTPEGLGDIFRIHYRDER